MDGASHGGVNERALSTLLNELDGIESDKVNRGLVVIGCTNRLEDLDSALIRPGRLHPWFELGLPTLQDRIDILELIKKQGTRISDDVDLHLIASSLEGCSGASIKAFVQ